MNRLRRKAPQGKRTEPARECYEIIKQVNNGVVDGDHAENSNYCHRIVVSIEGHTLVQFHSRGWKEVLLGVLTKAKENKYVARKVTSPKSIYNNLSELIATVELDSAEENKFSY